MFSNILQWKFHVSAWSDIHNEAGTTSVDQGSCFFSVKSKKHLLHVLLVQTFGPHFTQTRFCFYKNRTPHSSSKSLISFPLLRLLQSQFALVQIFFSLFPSAVNSTMSSDPLASNPGSASELLPSISYPLIEALGWQMSAADKSRWRCRRKTPSATAWHQSTLCFRRKLKRQD